MGSEMCIRDRGFKPAGIYHESIMLVGGRDQEIVLVHPDFPVTVYLNQHSSDTISVQLISHDSQGRFIVSTDNDYLELACDTRALCFRLVGSNDWKTF